MMLVFMLEERSMKVFLEGLLPRVLPPEVPFKLIPHEGKTDLERSIARKLRTWRTPDTRFVVVRDQDSGDCTKIKQRLSKLCHDAGKAEAHVVIACRELEAWFIGDLEAVGRAYDQPALAALQDKAKYRDPDHVSSPSRELAALVPGYGKVDGARRMGTCMPPDRSRSRSFTHFIRKVKAIAEAR
jgi:Domain of unknown function (DUF4276)